MLKRVRRLEAGIVMACREAGRSRTEISLMAVSKMHPALCDPRGRGVGHPDLRRKPGAGVSGEERCPWDGGHDRGGIPPDRPPAVE